MKDLLQSIKPPACPQPSVSQPQCALTNSCGHSVPLALVSPLDGYIHKGQAALPVVLVCHLMTLGLILPLFPT